MRPAFRNGCGRGVELDRFGTTKYQYFHENNPPMTYQDVYPVDIHYPLTDEPWGQRRFGLVDPNGMYVDVVEQTEPQPGFWERYPAED